MFLNGVFKVFFMGSAPLIPLHLGQTAQHWFIKSRDCCFLVEIEDVAISNISHGPELCKVEIVLTHSISSYSVMRKYSSAFILVTFCCCCQNY